MNRKSETFFSAFRPSVDVLKMSLIFTENYAHAKNNCQKCLFCFPEFNINSSILLPHSLSYHWIVFLSGYLMILT